VTEPTRIKFPYKPWHERFAAFHARTQRRAFLVCHRRAGKTEAAIYDMVWRALKLTNNWQATRPNAPPLFAYVAPLRKQAESVVWRRLKLAVRNIPGVKVYESKLQVILPGGAEITLYGADNPDALRGNYLDGVILDEYSDVKANVFSEIIRPMLADYKGWVVFTGTPKGKGNHFYTLFKQASNDSGKNWFYVMLKASESGILDPAEIEDMRLDMDEYEQAQELECSFEAALKGSYFGKNVAELYATQQILPGTDSRVQHDPTEQVHLAMDIGFDDATSIWFWQVVNGAVRVIDYWEERERDADDVVQMLDLRYDPNMYGTWWLPHDADHKTFRSKKSVINVLREYDAPVRVVPNPDQGNRVFHGVNNVRKVLRTYPIMFNADKCARGLESLKNYSRTFDREANVYSDTPKHDQWSHGADGFRYLCQALQPEDLARSRERHQSKVSAARNQINIGGDQINHAYTLNDAWADRKRQQQRERRRIEAI